MERKEYLFKGGSLHGKKRFVSKDLFYVPFLLDNGRFYCEKYRKNMKDLIFEYSGNTLTESEKAADSLCSWKEVGSNKDIKDFRRVM